MFESLLQTGLIFVVVIGLVFCLFGLFGERLQHESNRSVVKKPTGYRCHSVLCSPVLSVPPNTGH